jgi:hypothetical protein
MGSNRTLYFSSPPFAVPLPSRNQGKGARKDLFQNSVNYKSICQEETMEEIRLQLRDTLEHGWCKARYGRL